MKNTIKLCDSARSLSQEDYEKVKEYLKLGKIPLIEKAHSVLHGGIAALLGYISYKTFGSGDVLMGWLTALSAGEILFEDAITSILSGTISAVRIAANESTEEIDRRIQELKELTNKLRGMR